MVFIFDVGNHFFNVVDMAIKNVKIIYFFSSLCSKSLLSNGAVGFNLSILCSV